MTGKPTTAADAILDILGEQGRSQRSLALAVSITPQALVNRLSSSSMRVDSLCEMADELGYQVVLEDKADQQKSYVLRS